MRKIFNTIKAGVQAVKEKFVAIHAAAERRAHRISAKIRTAAAVTRPQRPLAVVV